MGRIKSALIKRASHQMLREENSFNDSFENNKKILGSSMPSKKTRNKIAGYIAIVKKREMNSKKREVKKEMPVTESS